MKAGEFLAKLLGKAGVDTTNETLKAILELDADIPDTIAAQADKALLTAEAAKSNPSIINAIKATTLAGADSKLDELITELGLQPGEEFLQEKNTYNKIATITKLALEAGKKAAGATSKTTSAEWELKEKQYNDQLKNLKESVATSTSKVAEIEKAAKINSRLERRILEKAKDLNLPAEMDVDLKIQIVTGAINGDLVKKGLKLEVDESGTLVVVDKDGNKAYNPTDNVPYEANTLFDGALAQNKLLKINDVSQQQQQHQPGVIVPGSAANSLISQELMNQAKALV